MFPVFSLLQYTYTSLICYIFAKPVCLRQITVYLLETFEYYKSIDTLPCIKMSVNICAMNGFIVC